MLVINIGIVATLHLLCASVAAPWTYKRRPKAYWRRIQTFEPLGPACMWSSELELKNTEYTLKHD